MASSSRKRTTSRKKAPPRQRTESREQSELRFRAWLDSMAEGLNEFFERLPAEVRDKLDFSVESLDVLEAWLLERYPDIEHTRQKSESQMLGGAARYIGETFLKHIGGRWDIELDDLRYIFFNVPQLVDLRSGMAAGPICPMSLATACTDRRRGNFISRLLRIQMADLSEHKQG
jgi:hypothetical protein